jgi:hypothetical protein
MRLEGASWRARARRWLGWSTELTLDAPPASLSATERDWLKARAEQVGGLTEVFVCLVRLNILTDAWIACCDEAKAIRLTTPGSRTQARRRVREETGRRAVAPLMARVLCAMTWVRPAPDASPGPYDDPARPLPHALTRRLIVEGRHVCEQSSHAARDANERRGQARGSRSVRPWTRADRLRSTPLRGLARAEAAWLARKARAVGGLDAALCALVRNGFDHEAIGRQMRDALLRRHRMRSDGHAPH